MPSTRGRPARQPGRDAQGGAAAPCVQGVKVFLRGFEVGDLEREAGLGRQQLGLEAHDLLL